MAQTTDDKTHLFFLIKKQTKIVLTKIRFFLVLENRSMLAMSSGTVKFKLQNTLRCHTKAINHLAISPDYSRLISIGTFSPSLNPTLLC
jgi:hypothetical protein